MKNLKIENPVLFQVGKEPCTCTFEGKEEIYPVSSGVYFDNKHYGFAVIKDGKEKTYPTSSPIKSAVSTRLFLHIFEEGKSSWKINAVNGKVLKNKSGEQEDTKKIR